ncbi:protein-disulfide reductase DsbD, partial [Desulfobacterales bacterium HSG16]|nr:protein-disulfide reductase DsbD [Desulfobacterales bacterium HSG16]
MKNYDNIKGVRRIFYLLGVLCLCFFAGLNSASAQVDPFKISVEKAVREAIPGQSLSVTVLFDMPAKHYIYADSLKIEPVAVEGISFKKAILPGSVKKHDKYIGAVQVYNKPLFINIPLDIDKNTVFGAKTLLFKISYQGCTEALCLMPAEKNISADIMVLSDSIKTLPVQAQDSGQLVLFKGEETEKISENDKKLQPVDPFQPVIETFAEPGIESGIEPVIAPVIKQDKAKTAIKEERAEKSQEENPFQNAAASFGLFGVLIAAFAWGFVTSLTPCVYPMIPVTMSVIGAGSAGNAYRGFLLSVVYVLGMSLIYAIFGLFAAMTGGLFGSNVNHPAVRVIVALVFTVLALSMFDLYYIQVPAFIRNRLDKAGGSSILGVFITGAVSGAVVSPCVGPMLVSLLVYIATVGDKLQGFLIMWSFSLGLGMLFLMVGTFSGFMASLPKAGSWMETMKHVFGVILLGIALYYIEPLLPENLFWLCIGILLIGTGVFAGAFDRINADSSVRDRLAKVVGIVCLTLGIVYAASFATDGRLFVTSGVKSTSETKIEKIVWIDDEESGLSRAKLTQQPIMIDFSADWCAACKKLEKETFTHPDVIREAEGLVCIKIDCTDTKDPRVKALQKKYGVHGLPTIVFLTSSGKIMPGRSIMEFIGPEQMVSNMR